MVLFICVLVYSVVIFWALFLTSFAIVASASIYELYSRERSDGEGKVMCE